MQGERYPLKMEKHSHGDLVATTAAEERAYAEMGWTAKPDTPPTYELFPMYLRGDGLPDLIVENDAEAKAATRQGYRLPSDDVVEEGKAAFAQAYEPEDEEYIAEEWPKFLSHPSYTPEIPGHWTYDRGPGGLAEGRFIAGRPAKFAPVLVNAPAEEAEWVAKGWTIGAEPLRGAHAHEAPAAPFPSSDPEDGNHASPPSIAATRKRPSGAQGRKRRREQMQAAQPEGAP